MSQENYTEVVGFEPPASAQDQPYSDPRVLRDRGPYDISDNVFEADEYGEFMEGLTAVGVDSEQETLHYMHDKSDIFGHMIHEWDDDVALFEDHDNVFWLAFENDEAGYVTAYFDGEKYVPANNPEIWENWETVTEGPWMELLESDRHTDRRDSLHPYHRKDIPDMD